jgi:hypothetical protein
MNGRERQRSSSWAGTSGRLAGSLAILRVLPQELTRSTGDNSGTLVLVTALLVLVALTACLIPARRALAVDPAQTLKEG